MAAKHPLGAEWGTSTTRAVCPHCNTGTALQLRDRRRPAPKWTQPGPTSVEIDTPAMRFYEEVWECMFCEATTIVFLNMIAMDGQELRTWGRIAYPLLTPRELPKDVPDEVRSLFTEASKAENAGALRGAAALYRAAVEELVKERGCQGADLHKKIEDLKTKGVDESVVDDLHQARITGNWSIHHGVKFSAEEIADVAELIGEAVVVLYVQPAERARLRAARQARDPRAAPAGTVAPPGTATT